MRIAVVALGKIGLPVAVQFAGSGHEVVGADTSPEVVRRIAAGQVPFPGEAELPERLAAEVAAGRLTATTDTAAAVAGSDAVVVVVPLVVDDAGAPDFTGLDAATAAIAEGLLRGGRGADARPPLVVYETTLPVGTTRTRFAPALRATAGPHVRVAFSPERVLTGRVFADLRRYPKVVGGVDPASEAAAVELYERVLQFDARPDLERPNGVWGLGSADAAELTKVAETTYRDVNIALANQFAVFAEGAGIDVRAVIAAANSQPYSHLHRPGIAVGGHCIPVYPRFQLWVDPAASVVRAARAANDAMPGHVVAALSAALGGGGALAGLRVVVLGAAYRGGVKETAFSGVFPAVAALTAAGASAVVHDPLFTDAELRERGLEPWHLGEPADAAVVHTDHAEYRDLRPEHLPGVRVVLDGRGVGGGEGWPDGAWRVYASGR